MSRYIGTAHAPANRHSVCNKLHTLPVAPNPSVAARLVQDLFVTFVIFVAEICFFFSPSVTFVSFVANLFLFLADSQSPKQRYLCEPRLPAPGGQVCGPYQPCGWQASLR